MLFANRPFLIRKTTFTIALSCISLLFTQNAIAVIQTQNFTVTDGANITGSGSFSFDDAGVSNGDSIAFGDTIALTLTISEAGGPVVVTGGTQTFTLADCTNISHQNFFPDFTNDLNYSCDNGTDEFGIISPNQSRYDSATITFAPTGALVGPIAGSTSPIKW
jgi:hypothetical protein